MRFWSKGLGKRCLSMDCGKEAVAIEGPAMVLSGKVRPPLGWAYTITMDETDWLDFIELTLHPTMIPYLLHRRRFGLALKAAWHLSLFYIAFAARLPAIWLRRAAAAPPASSPPSAGS